MQIALSDFVESDNKSNTFSTLDVKRIVMRAFASSVQVRGDAIRKIQSELSDHSHGEKVSVAIYEIARQHSTSISFYSKNWVALKFCGMRLLAWTSD